MFNELRSRNSRSGYLLLRISEDIHLSLVQLLADEIILIACMGTKIECAIDPLATSPNNNSFTLHYSVDDWNHFQIRELENKFQRSTGLSNNFRESMDRMLENQNIESIKKTMQFHEDIFKHQVQELHRLYSVQRKLMSEMKKECKENTRVWSSVASLDVNNSQFMINKRNHSTTQKNIYGCMLNFQNVIEDPSSRERSGSCSGETMKMARGFDLERPAVAVEDISTVVNAIDNEDQAAGPSSRLANNNKMSFDGSDEEIEVELTLSVGVNSSSKKKRSTSFQQQTTLHTQESGCLNRELDSPASFKSDRGEYFSSPNTPMSSSSATFDQEKKMPHWLFGLSINRN